MSDQLQLAFVSSLPKSKVFGKDTLLIYDKYFNKTPFKKWIDQFEVSYGVTGGEALKDVAAFPAHISKIVELTSNLSSRNLNIVVFGGGSLGDFGGFVASILKRGVGLIHIPSTWLAAIDSAHGGKTALNVGGYKNQIGTFYPAHQIYLVKDVLFHQPLQRAHESYSELIKMALLQGGDLWAKVSQLGAPSSEGIWSSLGAAIEAKYRVAAEDPEEQSGYRHILNLGHTVGHIFESVHHFPHGIAVNLGLDFALKWSVHKKYFDAQIYEQMMATPTMEWLIDAKSENLLLPKFQKKYEAALHQDKKKVAKKEVRFVYLSGVGSPLVESVKIEHILKELVRQGK